MNYFYKVEILSSIHYTKSLNISKKIFYYNSITKKKVDLHKFEICYANKYFKHLRYLKKLK